MSFQLPSEDDPFPKRFYTMMIFFIVFLIEFILPVVAAIFLLGMIVTICGNMLGLIQLDSPSETINQQTRADRADSADDPDPVQAVDEKTLLEIETRILEEMLQIRRARLDGLVKSEDLSDASWNARASRLGKGLWQVLNRPFVAQVIGSVIPVLVLWFSTQAS